MNDGKIDIPDAVVTPQWSNLKVTWWSSHLFGAKIRGLVSSKPFELKISLPELRVTFWGKKTSKYADKKNLFTEN